MTCVSEAFDVIGSLAASTGVGVVKKGLNAFEHQTYHECDRTL